MIRLRRWSALGGLFLIAGWLSTLHGQAPANKKAEEKPVKKPLKWLLDRTMAVTPAPAPVPALKYRFYPSSVERKPGNAVPIYLRFAHERTDARKKELREKPAEWNKLPLEQLPRDEVKKFLAENRYNLKQLELGARRKTADWNYTLDAGDPIGLLLPDTQEMRLHAPLLVLKARLEIAERRYADAIHTLETGFSFSQQITSGPFLINGLVGIACAHMFADCLLELIERPDAPNLYWALAVLPRSFLDLRDEIELEQIMLEMEWPDLADLDRPRAAEQWEVTLRDFRKNFERLSKLDNYYKGPKPGNASTDPAAKSPDLPAAKKYLTEVAEMSAARVEAMPPAQVLLLYLSKYYHELRDDVFKGSYLRFPQGQAIFNEAEKRLKSAPDTEAGHLARLLLPAIPKVQLAQVRIARKLAALRAIEALRTYAAANGGKLPDKLSQVSIVPVPNDPGTGKPFEYQRDGQTFTLTSIIPDAPPATNLRYRVTVRK
jgi:hypothetical protein